MKKLVILVALAAVTGTAAMFPAHDKMSMQIPKETLAIFAIRERSRGEFALELGISSQLWLSRAYLSPLMAQGYIAQILPKKPKSPLQRYRLLRKGKDVLA